MAWEWLSLQNIYFEWTFLMTYMTLTMPINLRNKYMILWKRSTTEIDENKNVVSWYLIYLINGEKFMEIQ